MTSNRDPQLNRELLSIGKTCFLDYFPDLNQLPLPDEVVARKMVDRDQEGWTSLDCREVASNCDS